MAIFANCYSRDVSSSRFYDETKEFEKEQQETNSQTYPFSEQRWLERPIRVIGSLGGAVFAKNIEERSKQAGI